MTPRHQRWGSRKGERCWFRNRTSERQAIRSNTAHPAGTENATPRHPRISLAFFARENAPLKQPEGRDFPGLPFFRWLSGAERSGAKGGTRERKEERKRCHCALSPMLIRQDRRGVRPARTGGFALKRRVREGACRHAAGIGRHSWAFFWDCFLPRRSG